MQTLVDMTVKYFVVTFQFLLLIFKITVLNKVSSQNLRSKIQYQQELWSNYSVIGNLAHPNLKIGDPFVREKSQLVGKYMVSSVSVSNGKPATQARQNRRSQHAGKKGTSQKP